MKLVFDNDRVRIYDVRLQPGEQIVRQYLPYNTIRWQVNDYAHYYNSVDDEKQRHFIADKTVIWDPVGTFCTIQNANIPTIRTTTTSTDTARGTDHPNHDENNENHQNNEFRQIWFQIKQSIPKHVHESIVQHKLHNAIFPTNVGTTI